MGDTRADLVLEAHCFSASVASVCVCVYFCVSFTEKIASPTPSPSPPTGLLPNSDMVIISVPGGWVNVVIVACGILQGISSYPINFSNSREIFVASPARLMANIYRCYAINDIDHLHSHRANFHNVPFIIRGRN